MLITAVLVMIVFAAAADQLNAPGVKVRTLLWQFSNEIFILSGFCAPGHRFVHHHLSSFRHPLHWLQHEPGQKVSGG